MGCSDWLVQCPGKKGLEPLASTEKKAWSHGKGVGRGWVGGELGEEKEKRFGKTLLEGCRVKAFLSYVTIFNVSL